LDGVGVVKETATTERQTMYTHDERQCQTEEPIPGGAGR